MDTAQTTHLSLCSGYGGIDLGLRRAIPNLRTIAYAEIEAFACENLLARMEGGQLDASPIWPDLKTFPWGAFSDRVDILSGGYPCQPFSAAGKRLGTDDPRHLWPYIADGIRILRPRLCFFENVEGHITLGLREVIGELESMDYKVSWGIFSAREVGAPHQRKRVFILAHRDRERGQLSDWWRESAEQILISNGEERRAWPSRPGEPQHGWEPPRVVANSESQRAITGDAQRGEGSELADSNATGRKDWPEQHWRECSPSIEGINSTSRCGVVSSTDGSDMANARSVCGDRPDPDRVCGREICEPTRGNEVRSEDSGCGESDGAMGNSEGGMPRQSSAGNWREGAGGASETGELGNAEGQRVERWQYDNSGGNRQGGGTQKSCGSSGSATEFGQAQPPLGRDFDGSADRLDYAELSVSCDNRTDELRLLGNGVVPATATLAFKTLLAELLTL